jgi:hypothetical protein
VNIWIDKKNLIIGKPLNIDQTDGIKKAYTDSENCKNVIKFKNHSA